MEHIRSERQGPDGLEKCDTKTSRGPQHLSGPPQKRNGYYSKQKISSMRDYEVRWKKNTDRQEKKLRSEKIKMQEAACAQKNL
jgi:hypothetical protein